MRLGVVVAALTLPLLAACGGSSGGGVTTTDGMSTIKLASSITGSSFLAVTAGIDQGFFKNNKVNVEVIKVKSTAEGTAALASGDANISAMLTEGVIAARANGAEIKIIANLLTQDQHILYAKPGTTKVADLTGKKLGVVGPGSGTEMLAKALAKDAGVGESAIQYIPTGAAATQLSSLLSGQIDAAGLVPPYDAKAKAGGMVKVLDYRDKFPDLTPQVFASSEKSIGADKDALTAFVKGYTESAKWVQDHPDEAVALLAKDAQISPADAKESYEFARPDYSTTGQVAESGLQKWLDLTKSYGAIKKALPTPADLYDSSLIPATS